MARLAPAKVKFRWDGNPYISPEEHPDDSLFDTLPEETILCKCLDTTFGDVIRCVSYGMTTLDEVIEETAAGSTCQKCRHLIQQALNQALKKQI